MKKIPLSGKRGKGKFALVDDADYEELSKFKWHLAAKEYATRSFVKGDKTCFIRMHRQITGFDLTDHHDGDGLNNQRYNLRDATNSKNTMNSKKRKNCTSKYKGVSWKERDDRYYSSIVFEGKSIHLGTFKKDEEHLAALAYNSAAKEMFGEFARLNDVITCQHTGGKL